MHEQGLRIQRRRSHDAYEDILQQRFKTKWIDGSTPTTGYYTWGEWADVPVVTKED